MVIIAAQIEENGLRKKFYEEVKKAQSPLEDIERKFTGNSNLEVCSAIFAQWNFEKTMVAAIRASEAPKSWHKDIQPYAYALKAVREAVTLAGKITKESAAEALKTAQEGGLQQDPLMAAFEKLVKMTGPGIIFLQN
jgi:HD-like signal output (HDOD) protein